mgnify:CR=1 FL=1
MIKSNILPYAVLVLSITTVLIALMWIDHETTSWSQVFPYGILFMWLIYGLPILVVLTFVYLFLKKKIDQWFSMILTIMFGTPIITVFLILIYMPILQ